MGCQTVSTSSQLLQHRMVMRACQDWAVGGKRPGSLVGLISIIVGGRLVRHKQSFDLLIIVCSTLTRPLRLFWCIVPLYIHHTVNIIHHWTDWFQSSRKKHHRRILKNPPQSPTHLNPPQPNPTNPTSPFNQHLPHLHQQFIPHDPSLELAVHTTKPIRYQANGYLKTTKR